MNISNDLTLLNVNLYSELIYFKYNSLILKQMKVHLHK